MFINEISTNYPYGYFEGGGGRTSEYQLKNKSLSTEDWRSSRRLANPK